MQFHVAHIVAPDPKLHGLFGYQEIVDTLVWGLSQLGHDVTTAQNEIDPDAVNIVLGFQMMDGAMIDTLPDNTIIYNLEQLANIPTDTMKSCFPAAARRLVIWDYDEKNLDAWREVGSAHEPVLLPVGWAPPLVKIPKRDQDIDVLFYGIPGKTRLGVYWALAQAGLRSVYICGFYGPQRDEFIARSKIVLNINKYEISRVFEIVRVSYLLANGKAVVSDIYPESRIDPDLHEAVAFCSKEQMLETCQKLIADEPARLALEQRGQAWMQKRDIRPLLQKVLGQTI
jgi:hypothetical protein